jgi:hypothetical protein
MRAWKSFVGGALPCNRDVILRQQVAARVPHPPKAGKRAALAGLYDFGA